MSNSLLLSVGIGLLSLVVIVLWWDRSRTMSDIHDLSNFIKTSKDPSQDQRTNVGRSLAHALKRALAERDFSIEKRTAKISRLESTLDQISDAVLIVNSEGKVTFANPSAMRIFPYKGEIVGTAISLILRHHDLIQLWQVSQNTHSPSARTTELNFGKQTVQVFAIPDTYEDGVILHIRDLSDLRKTESIRRDFVSNISHELRTPLASIKALAETMLEYGDEDPAMSKKFTQNIITEVDALSHMAAELLELTRIESGQVPFDFQPVNPGQLLEKVAERLSAQADRSGLTLTITFEPELPLIKADPPRLEQVLVNLLHNAIKFSPSGEQIQLTAKRSDGFVRLSVIDNGIGISEDKQSRVFERFYRTDSARAGGGTGLGLSIAKHIVEGHKGKIEVLSTEGKGSDFSITIPVWYK